MPLHVIRPILHADQEQAELCLEFDQGLDTAGSAGRVAGAVHLDSDGKIVPVSSRDLSLGGNQLCLLGLEHRKDYRLVLNPLRDARGERLSHPYSLSFTMPPRRASLAFVIEDNRKGQRRGAASGLVRWRDHPVLHSVNSAHVRLELYRITDPALMVQAWNQRLQTGLAPSESLYFARNNGVPVWQDDLALSPPPDKNIDTKIDFAGKNPGDFPPGLYLLAATDADEKPVQEKTVRDDEDKSDENKSELTPTAAIWLLHSDLRLAALRDDKAYTVTAETLDASALLAGIRILAMDRDQKILAEAKSDANGLAVVKPDKIGDAQNLLGIGDKGDAAFVDLAATVQNPVLPPLTATMSMDRTIYAPADAVNVALAARDLHRHPASLSGSVLQLLRPDRSLYDSRNVTLDVNGSAHLSFAAPVASGLWHMVWKQPNGETLAEADVRISSNPAAPVLGVTADRALLTPGGNVNLAIRSGTPGKLPAPFIAGHVELAWVKPEHPFPEWKDYDFDDGRLVDSRPQPAGSFVTDAEGMAHLPVVLPSADQPALLRQMQLRVTADPAFAALDPEPLVLPVKSSGIVLGIKPRANKGHFPENSMARFDVVALDGDGQRRTVDDLSFQIYEEGRNFEWLQSEGHWDYRPLRQRWRVGGGNLSLPDNSPGLIEWPVTSGTYQLDITDADGNLLARGNFNAGWGSADADKPEPAVLDLKASPLLLPAGAPEKIDFMLKRPALVTATIADDHVRSILHAAYPPGANSIAFTPAADWGSHVLVRIEARYGIGDSEAGSITLSSAAENTASAPRAPVKSPPASKTEFLANTVPGLRETSHQTLAQKQSWNAAAEGKHHAAPGIAFLAPEPFFNAPAFLSAALSRQPFAARDMARQLALLRLWHDVILSANLMTEAEWKARSNDLLLRLLARQNKDGGFAAVPGEASDIISTAAAIESLAAANDAMTKPAIEQGAQWLRHLFENTWFDEKERPERAAAFAALAAAGKMDPAALHYFSDTSADKPLPPLACAQMAYAFAAIHDKPAASFWTDKTKDAGKGSFPSDSLPVLFANEFFAPGNGPALIENGAKNALSPAAQDQFLLALWFFENRAGAWHYETGKETKTAHGILALPATEKPLLAFRNASDRPLYLAVAAPAKAAVRRNDQRRFYNLSGGEVKGRLARGSVYLVMLEGAWPEEAKEEWLVEDNPQPSLVPVTCAIEAPSGDGFLGWLAYKTLSPVKACEKGASGLAVLLSRDEKNAGHWRIAYLARAESEHDQIRAATADVSPDDKDGRP